MITGTTFIHRNDLNFLASDLGSEIIMMNMESGDYLGLNEVSADIWKLLETPRKFDELVAFLMSQYDIGMERCENETRSFLEKILERNMISIRND